MEAMTILQNCRRIDKDRAWYRRRINDRRDVLTSISPGLNPIGASGKGAGLDARYAAFAADVDQLERQLRDREDAYKAEMIAACLILDMINHPESEVLRRYYLGIEGIGHIAREMGYSESHVWRLKKQGLEQVAALDAQAVDSFLPPWYENLHLET